MKRKVWLGLVLLIVFAYFNNSNLFVETRQGKPLLLAHRGLAQTFGMDGITNDTDTSKRIYSPEHPFLENTIASMDAAFQAGADIVELDIQLTRDGQFAVFHDAELHYRTNGVGAVRNYIMQELRRLDVGYGYTADGGQTFPFRDKGIGLMPSLNEVIEHFPDRSLLLHIKSNDPREGEHLAQYLSTIPAKQRDKLAVYGGERPIAVLQAKLPDLRVMSKKTLLTGLFSYLAVGWTGYVPASCRNTQWHVPEKYAAWLWGWPDRFLNRMDAVDTRVILVAGDGRFSAGFDTPEDLKRLPPHYTGGIWTNRIDRIAKIL